MLVSKCTITIYAFHKAIILLLCYIMSLISDPSTFFFVSCACMTITCDIISHPLSKFKIKKLKSENKN